MKPQGFFISIPLVVLLLIPAFQSRAQALAARPVVHAVLFYSPTCPHCHYVITETLPPLMEKYGDQLQIIGVDVNQPKGQTLFLAALQEFGVKEGGVPFLVVGDSYLVGSQDIPEKFPGLIQAGLSHGGVDWPEIPGLAGFIPATQVVARPAVIPSPPYPNVATSAPAAQPGILLPDAQSANWATNFSRDPLGNSLAVAVLAGILASVGGAVIFLRRTRDGLAALHSGWLIPVLCVLGLGVATYLSYVETAHAQAVCGPVGDCNTVQQSPYARLFGVVPIGLLGVMGYALILVVSISRRFLAGRHSPTLDLALFAMARFGMLFSIYLTFLEPFVIGATCAWCLTSSVIMMMLFWMTLPGVGRTLSRGTALGTRSGNG